jgi:hypothetical protein
MKKLILFCVLFISACQPAQPIVVSYPTTTPSAPIHIKSKYQNPQEPIDIQDYTVMLNEASIVGKSKLMVNFTVDNSSGSKERIISSMLNFSAKDGDGTKLDYAICDSHQLDGKVQAGDKLKGYVCWDGANINGKYDVTFDSSPFAGSDSATWLIAH